MKPSSHSTNNNSSYSKVEKRRRTNTNTTHLRKNAFSIPAIFGTASFFFILVLLWTQSRNVSHLSQSLCTTTTTTTGLFSIQQQSLSSFAESRSSRNKLGGQQRSDADIYHDAWYIADTPDWDAHHRIYEDAHIQRLVQEHQQKGSSAAYKPYQVHEKKDNRSSTLNKRDSANHPILTTLRTVESTTKGFFNPVCQYYRFPNVTLFPTISVIIPMQFGTTNGIEKHTHKGCRVILVPTVFSSHTKSLHSFAFCYRTRWIIITHCTQFVGTDATRNFTSNYCRR